MALLYALLLSSNRINLIVPDLVSIHLFALKSWNHVTRSNFFHETFSFLVHKNRPSNEYRLLVKSYQFSICDWVCLDVFYVLQRSSSFLSYWQWSVSQLFWLYSLIYNVRHIPVVLFTHFYVRTNHLLLLQPHCLQGIWLLFSLVSCFHTCHTTVCILINSSAFTFKKIFTPSSSACFLI